MQHLQTAVTWPGKTMLSLYHVLMHYNGLSMHQLAGGITPLSLTGQFLLYRPKGLPVVLIIEDGDPVTGGKAPGYLTRVCVHRAIMT